MRIESSNLKIGKLPDLRIVNMKSLRFHEEHDELRTRKLAERLESDGFLKNPPVAASIEDSSDLILLDGANRVSALSRLRIEHVPAQVVALSDPCLVVSTWGHAVEKLGKDYFLGKITARAGLEITRSGDGTAKNTFLCALTFRDEEIYYLHDGSGLNKRIDQLEFITGMYRHTDLSDRVSYTETEYLTAHYPDFQTLITFQEFTKDEIAMLADNGRKLPSGLTRIVLPRRALGLNVGLDILRSPDDLDEKNRWLKRLIHDKVIEKSIRFYQEQTFMFNE